MGKHYTQDPDDVLDYVIDWSDWLDGDTIASSSWTVDGVTQDDDDNTTTTTTIWISGGTVGVIGSATNHIVTAAGREKDQTITFTIMEQ